MTKISAVSVSFCGAALLLTLPGIVGCGSRSSAPSHSPQAASSRRPLSPNSAVSTSFFDYFFLSKRHAALHLARCTSPDGCQVVGFHGAPQQTVAFNQCALVPESGLTRSAGPSHLVLPAQLTEVTAPIHLLGCRSDEGDARCPFPHGAELPGEWSTGKSPPLRTVRVGVVDDTVRLDHPGLKKLARAADQSYVAWRVDDKGAIVQRGANDEPTGSEHGTAVAGILAAEAGLEDAASHVPAGGFAPNAELVTYAMHCDGRKCDPAEGFAFLQKAAEASEKVEIVVMSWSTADPCICQMYQQLLASGAAVVFASDNVSDFPANCEVPPEIAPRGIAVNVRPAGAQSTWLDAPQSVCTLWDAGGIAPFTGTSAAAPVVASAVAVALGWKDWSIDAAIAHVVSRSRPKPDANASAIRNVQLCNIPCEDGACSCESP